MMESARISSNNTTIVYGLFSNLMHDIMHTRKDRTVFNVHLRHVLGGSKLAAAEFVRPNRGWPVRADLVSAECPTK